MIMKNNIRIGQNLLSTMLRKQYSLHQSNFITKTFFPLQTFHPHHIRQYCSIIVIGSPQSTATRTRTLSNPSSYLNIWNHNTYPSSNLSIRWFGKRKAGRMAQHIRNIEERAHEIAHEKAKGRKAAAKNKDSSGRTIDDTTTDHLLEEDDDGSNEKEYQFEKSADDDDEEGGGPTLPEKEDVKTRMMNVVNGLERSFRSVRGSEPTPELFENIAVEAYGSGHVPLGTVAQVVVASSNRVVITPYDPSLCTSVRDAVRISLELNPQMGGDGYGDGDIIVSVPRPSMESRKQIVKQLGKAAERAKQRVRRIRRGAQDVVKKGKDGKLDGISKDDAFRVGKEIDLVTEEIITKLNEILEKKQDSVMAV